MDRVLLATIKNLGRSPCPRCLIKKDQIPSVGTKADMSLRRKLRVDSQHRQAKVEKARSLMFNSSAAVTSKQVERILGDQSMVPTHVSAWATDRC